MIKFVFPTRDEEKGYLTCPLFNGVMKFYLSPTQVLGQVSCDQPNQNRLYFRVRGCRDEVLLGTVVGEKSVNYGTEG
jgi:hypothetical protein